MLGHAYAPNAMSPPELFVKYSWVKELGLRWDDVGGITISELGLLTELINIYNEAQALKQRVASKR